MHIFISYPRKDIDKAHLLKNALFEGGHTVWMDDQLITGQAWREQLENQIKKSDAIALALTPNWSASPYCQWEFVTAVENGKKIIPVLLEKISLPDRISRYQYADLSDGFDDTKVEKLLNDLVTLVQTIEPSVTADMDKSAYAQQIDESITANGNNNTITRAGNISINGNVKGGNVNIGGSQTFHGNVMINVDQWDAAENDRKQLEELVKQLNIALKTIPQDDAEVIETLAQDAINEATKDAPNKRLLDIKGESLKKAAENLLAVSPIVAKIVQKLLMIG
ncbi:MAG: toll/interleukin-1 receptor domain-containing protein [Anaerolineae bacterium]|nr:toll/interleukin-1 receptor domain-containing protein [Anaerolineae bacterium]